MIIMGELEVNRDLVLKAKPFVSHSKGFGAPTFLSSVTSSVYAEFVDPRIQAQGIIQIL